MSAPAVVIASDAEAIAASLSVAQGVQSLTPLLSRFRVRTWLTIQPVNSPLSPSDNGRDHTMKRIHYNLSRADLLT